MTTALILRRQTIAMPRIPRERRLNAAATMVFVDAGILVMQPIIVTLAILIAAAYWSASTYPNDVSGSPPSVASSVGPGTQSPFGPAPSEAQYHR